MACPIITYGIGKRIGYKAVGLHKSPIIRNLFFQQAVFISHKSRRYNIPPKTKVFDYKNKKVNFYNAIFKKGTENFDENTKMIVVEGLPNVGKDKFCKQLANEFDMLYVPPFNFDEYYITTTQNIDLRDYDEELPLKLQTHDLKKFLKQPVHVNTAHHQLNQLCLKLDCYCDAVMHILSTGQGAVVQRSPFSDYIFVQAMLNAGYLSKAFHSYYYKVVSQLLNELLKPNLLIYLDADVNQALENIRTNGDEDEKKSSVFNTKFLSDLDNMFKNSLFQRISSDCHLLKYKALKEIDMYKVIDDIENLKYNTKYEPVNICDWDFENLDYFDELQFYSPFTRPEVHQKIYSDEIIDVEELILSPEEALFSEKYENESFGHRYEYGYDPDLDGNLLFKTKEYSTHEIREARIKARELKKLENTQ